MTLLLTNITEFDLDRVKSKAIFSKTYKISDLKVHFRTKILGTVTFQENHQTCLNHST